jgi:hypothetical protein
MDAGRITPQRLVMGDEVQGFDDGKRLGPFNTIW